MTGITVAIPTIPPRALDLFPHAVSSAMRQELQPAAISVAVDKWHHGAWATRQRALDAVLTDWTAFLDDDDEFYPKHLWTLHTEATRKNADYVYSYYDTARTYDYLGGFGKQFNPACPSHTTMTILVRTELAKAVGFSPRDNGDEAGGEDWRFTLGCVAQGAKIVHVPAQTWYWRHHWKYPNGERTLANTSGREDRW